VRAVLSLVFITSLAWGQTAKTRPIDQAGIDRLVTATGGQASISINRANGTARFINLPDAAAPAANAAAPLRAAGARNYDQDSRQFLNQYSTLFGIRDANNDLKLVQEEAVSTTGGRHLTYRQYHGGVPVFGGMVKTHFDESGALRSINGMTVPDLGMNRTASISAKRAAQIAVDKVNRELKPKIAAGSSGTGLFVYQQGLTKGVDLGTHLVWQVVVDNKANVREYVFIDAHTGKFVDQITGIQDGLYRRAYDGANLPTVTSSVVYPGQKEMNVPFHEAFGQL
jgi:Zn-dependent metalloprotease